MLLCFFLLIEERLEEVRLCGRQGLRPHGHGLDVFLERFGFFKGVLDGAVEDRLGLCGRLALCLTNESRFFLTFTCLNSSFHGLTGAASPFVLDAACSVYVFCDRP